MFHVFAVAVLMAVLPGELHLDILRGHFVALDTNFSLNYISFECVIGFHISEKIAKRVIFSV